MTDDLHDLSLADLSRLIAARKLSPVELVEALIQRVTQHDAQTRAFITPTFELARRQARPAEAEIAAGRYVIDFIPDPTLRAGVRLEWTARPEWDDWARWSEGCYVLRTNVTDWSPDELWRTYIQLTDAEAAFRIQKSELGIRPVWHQRADRVQAHVLVCFLAYVLWKTLEQWQRRAGLGQSPRTILDELRRIQSTDVVLPTEDGRDLRLRCVVRPDAAQAALLHRLGLELPERLRIKPPALEPVSV
jgi:hypothetical protein